MTDVNLFKNKLEGDYSSNFLDWRIFKIKDGNLVKKPIVVTVDAKLLRDAYPPNEVIDAMLKYLTTKYDHMKLNKLRQRLLTYPSWYSPLFILKTKRTAKTSTQRTSLL